MINRADPDQLAHGPVSTLYTRVIFLCSYNGRFNENSDSKCIYHAYIWKD